MTTALPPAISDSSVTLTWGAAHVYYGYCTIADVMFEFTNQENMMAKALAPSAVAQEITYTATNSLQPVLNNFYEMPYAGSDPTILSTLRELNVKYAVVQLIDRYMAANDTTSGVAASCMHRVGGIIADLEHGNMRWDPPFGDAVPRSELPVYPRASLLLVSPNPTLHHSQRPTFTMRRRSFDRRVAY